MTLHHEEHEGPEGESLQPQNKSLDFFKPFMSFMVDGFGVQHSETHSSLWEGESRASDLRHRKICKAVSNVRQVIRKNREDGTALTA